ncbi:MAG TPA: hypothetical protein VFG52_12370, partial [Xanthomonadales bacterium]|nr:hypothetical protein [Xanthomonadales bacterium]
MPTPAEYQALVEGRYNNPFAILGPHREGDKRWVRCLLPQASHVELLDRTGKKLAGMTRCHPGGVFEAILPPRLRHYLLRIAMPDGSESVIEDPYRFPSMFGDLDLYLLGEGSHSDIYRRLGSHVCNNQGVAGTVFSV